MTSWQKTSNAFLTKERVLKTSLSIEACNRSPPRSILPRFDHLMILLSLSITRIEPSILLQFCERNGLVTHGSSRATFLRSFCSFLFARADQLLIEQPIPRKTRDTMVSAVKG